MFAFSFVSNHHFFRQPFFQTPQRNRWGRIIDDLATTPYDPKRRKCRRLLQLSPQPKKLPATVKRNVLIAAKPTKSTILRQQVLENKSKKNESSQQQQCIQPRNRTVNKGAAQLQRQHRNPLTGGPRLQGNGHGTVFHELVDRQEFRQSIRKSNYATSVSSPLMETQPSTRQLRRYGLPPAARVLSTQKGSKATPHPRVRKNDGGVDTEVQLTSVTGEEYGQTSSSFEHATIPHDADLLDEKFEFPGVTFSPPNSEVDENVHLGNIELGKSCLPLPAPTVATVSNTLQSSTNQVTVRNTENVGPTIQVLESLVKDVPSFFGELTPTARYFTGISETLGNVEVEDRVF